MKSTISEEDLEKALVDPASVFSTPAAVLDERSLTREQKIEILRRWEYDAREMQVADEEGFPARKPGVLLDSVLKALHSLGAGPDTERSPPTKQGGA
jgi:hypothetical protein